jgi:hypothetical protein
MHGGVERYRYRLGNGRMLMVVGARPRRWYYGECADVKITSWKPAGMCKSMRGAMKAATDMIGEMVANQESVIDGEQVP